MGLLTAGLFQGLGKGISDAAQIGYKQEMEDRGKEKDKAFQLQRDDTKFQRDMQMDATKFEQGLEAARRTVQIQHDLVQQYGQIAATDAQKAMQQAGGDPVKAMQLTTNPDAQKFISAWQGATNDQAKTKADIAQSNSITAKNNAEISSGADASKREKEIRKLQALYVSMGASDPEFAKATRTKIIALGGKDPAAQESGKYSPIMEEDVGGAKRMTGVLNEKTGFVTSPNPGPSPKGGAADPLGLRSGASSAKPSAHPSSKPAAKQMTDKEAVSQVRTIGGGQYQWFDSRTGTYHTGYRVPGAD